jgi:hypothetical protein
MGGAVCPSAVLTGVTTVKAFGFGGMLRSKMESGGSKPANRIA